MEITDKIIDKLQKRITKPCLYKFFDYSLEELQDNPDCLRNIISYLELHEGKYEDFDIHTWIDAETFSPRIMIELLPIAEYRTHIKSNMSNRFVELLQTTKE